MQSAPRAFFLRPGQSGVRPAARASASSLAPRMGPLRRAGRVAALAICARLVSAAISLAAASSFPALDAAGPLVHQPCRNGEGEEPTLSPLTISLTAWDGAFFSRAAACGFGQHDASTAAFGPGTGGLAGRAAAAVLAPLSLSPPAAALAASWAASAVGAAAWDAVAAAYLPQKETGAHTLATLLLIISPAAPFAAALYGESWHSLGLGLALLLASAGRPWASAAGLALASAARSTGVLAAFWALATPPVKARGLRGVADRVARAALAAAPTLIWQACAWAAFCKGGEEGTLRPPWCDARLALPCGLSLPSPPLLAVQARDWGVGPGRYWRWTNAPHFALAAPALAISVRGVVLGGGSGLASPPGGVPGKKRKTFSTPFPSLPFSLRTLKTSDDSHFKF